MRLEKDRRALLIKFVERILDQQDYNMLYDLAASSLAKEYNDYSYDELVNEIEDHGFDDLLGEDDE